MAADWLFEDGATRRTLETWTRDALQALWDARSALEQTDADRPAARDERQLREAAGLIAEVRQRLRLIDAQLLGDAQSLLEEITTRAEQRGREHLHKTA